MSLLTIAKNSLILKIRLPCLSVSSIIMSPLNPLANSCLNDIEIVEQISTTNASMDNKNDITLYSIEIESEKNTKLQEIKVTSNVDNDKNQLIKSLVFSTTEKLLHSAFQIIGNFGSQENIIECLFRAFKPIALDILKIEKLGQNCTNYFLLLFF